MAVGVALAVHALLPEQAVRSHNALTIVVSTALLLVAASLRHAQHLLTGSSEVRTRAQVTALFGLLLMPLHLWTHTSLDTGASSPAQLVALAVVRTTVAVAVMALLVTAFSRHERRRVAVGAASVVGPVLAVTTLAAVWWPAAAPGLLRATGVLVAALWVGSAWCAARRSRSHPWAGALTPSLLLMGVTEVLVAVDPRVPGPGATAAMLVITVLAATAAAAAQADLRAAVRAETCRAAQLETDLLRTRDDLAALQQHERALSHHARGTLAGLRAAVQIWASVPAPRDTDPYDAAADLRRAALEEITSLDESLRRHRVELVGGPVALDLVVGRAARAARSRGAEVVVDVPPLVVLGQLVDLESALREVLDASVQEAAGRRVEVRATHDGQVARVAVTVRAPRAHHPRPDGPGAAHDRAARLMHRQRGVLERDEAAGAVRLVIPLCPPPGRRTPGVPGAPAGQVGQVGATVPRLPRQRTAADAPRSVGGVPGR